MNCEICGVEHGVYMDGLLVVSCKFTKDTVTTTLVDPKNITLIYSEGQAG